MNVRQDWIRWTCSISNIPRKRLKDTMQHVSSHSLSNSLPADVQRRPGAHIRVEGLTHRYRRTKEALEQIGFTIEPGEHVALLGRSGCGKSTLLHVIAGLLKPSRGQVHINGERVDRPSPRWIMMFQQPSLLPWLTVAGNVALGLQFRRDSCRREPRPCGSPAAGGTGGVGGPQRPGAFRRPAAARGPCPLAA